jgi:hypothetical protein
MTTTTIDCDTCPVRGRHCGDCFVPVLGRLWLGTPEQVARPAPEPEETSQTDHEERPRPDRTAPLDTDELAAVSAFVRAGLVDPDEAARARAELTVTTGYAVG